ncbi:MAG TPA: ABC transporter permease [Bryobacteraceae bacterium]|jgi:peptide/nickel transport system permease protein|nr:ABC transporter permease [Bryobacteraceae bacterium]
MKKAAVALLIAVALCALLAPAIAPYDYSRQFRESPNAPAGRQFLMGTDDLGRDRFSRLIYATRFSILLAPAAAAVSILVALLASAISVFRARWAEQGLSGLTTLSMSLPWIFLFIMLRAMLPLNTRPAVSILVTFGLMGIAGWAWPARIFTASIRQMADSGWLLQARASGVSPRRIALVHAWPHLRAVAGAQFRALLPAYILSEASLGLLGLGVAEPLPSWGNLLAELQHPDRVTDNPWILAPLGLLMAVMICLEAMA